MKGNGQTIDILFRKLYFFCLPTAGMRTRYILKHKKMFHHIGNRFIWQPRQFPADPELISIGDNVSIASSVVFVNHDIVSQMLNRLYESKQFDELWDGIEIGNNVMVGTRTIILPGVRIGSNVIIGAGSIVSKDIPDNCVAAGVPCKPVKDFDSYVEKRKTMKCLRNTELIWERFNENHKK